MRPALVTGLVLLAAVATGIGLYLRESDRADQAETRSADTAVLPPPTAVEGEQIETQAVAPGATNAGDETESVRSLMETAREVFEQSMVRTVQDFRGDLQAFIDEAELLPAQDHEPRARELLARVRTLEENGYLTAPEALALRLSLLRYALPPDDYRAAAATLIDDARQRAEAAERDWAARSDPRLEAYRKLEREIVEESLAMSEFPDGMTRQAYLRERLQALRSEIYSPDWSGAAEE